MRTCLTLPAAAALLMLAAVLAPAAPALADAQQDYEAGVAAHARGDVVTAMELLEHATNQGHVPAMVRLAYLLDKAEANLDAFRMYRRAAETGSAEAALALGVMYATGEGGTQDSALALAWITRAAQAGHGPAMLVLAKAHLEGALGLAPDRDAAIAWLEPGAAAGYAPAQSELEQLRRTPPPTDTPRPGAR